MFSYPLKCQENQEYAGGRTYNPWSNFEAFTVSQKSESGLGTQQIKFKANLTDFGLEVNINWLGAINPDGSLLSFWYV